MLRVVPHISFSNVFRLQARDLERLNYISTRSLNLPKVLNIYSEPIDTLSTAWEHLTDLSEKWICKGNPYSKDFLTNLKIWQKWPNFCDFLNEVHSYDKTFQRVQGDCQCGPFTTNIILLKFEDFKKTQFFEKKSSPPPGMVPSLL